MPRNAPTAPKRTQKGRYRRGSAVAAAVPATVEAVAALAVAVRPDPAVAAARAARIEGVDSIRHAHHVGELVGLRSRLRMARPTRRNRTRLDAVCAELAALGVA